MHIEIICINTHKYDATRSSSTHLKEATKRLPSPIQHHRFICTSSSTRNTMATSNEQERDAEEENDWKNSF